MRDAGGERCGASSHECHVRQAERGADHHPVLPMKSGLRSRNSRSLFGSGANSSTEPIELELKLLLDRCGSTSHILEELRCFEDCRCCVK